MRIKTRNKHLKERMDSYKQKLKQERPQNEKEKLKNIIQIYKELIKG